MLFSAASQLSRKFFLATSTHLQKGASQMEVRPYLTAGAAIVTTGALVVAMPAIVPSPVGESLKRTERH